jgi:hypothetical protein
VFDDAVPATLKAFTDREFAGEELLWAERPDNRIAVLLSFGVWIFALPWTAFSLFWISVPGAALYEAYAGVDIGAPKGAPDIMMWAFALWGVPFVLIGFGMLLAPYFTWRKGGKISGLSRTEGPDGRGTLTVSLGYERDSEGGRVPKSAVFGVIRDVRGVEQMVRALADRKP